MAKKVRISASQQHRAEQRAIDLESEKERTYLGSARIALSHLTFDDPPDREIDCRNEEFLVESIRRNGCAHLDPMSQLVATVSQQDLDAALSDSDIVAEALLNRNPVQLPLLPLPPGYHLRCLFGWHRVEAAKKVLPQADQWWVVNLYSDGTSWPRSGFVLTSTDLSLELRNSLVHQGANEKLRNQGEVFYHILRSTIQLNPIAEDFWWSRLHSRDQRQEARQLLGRREYRTALGALVNVQPLFLDFRTGMIGKLLRLKSDEEVLRGLRRITDFWTSIFGDQATTLQKIERHDIQTLELRCPAICTSDRIFLEPLFRSGGVCRRFSALERDQIWAALLRYKSLIPSFRTFFENLKYLIAIVETLKELVHPERRQTVADAFEEAFHPRQEDDIGAQKGYRSLVVYVMQQFSLLRPESLLVGDSPKETTLPSAVAIYELAAFADRLGFQSTAITKMLSQDPDLIAARQALLGARASIATNCSTVHIDAYSRQIAAIFKDFRQSQVDPPSAGLLQDGTGIA